MVLGKQSPLGSEAFHRTSLLFYIPDYYEKRAQSMNVQCDDMSQSKHAMFHTQSKNMAQAPPSQHPAQATPSCFSQPNFVLPSFEFHVYRM